MSVRQRIGYFVINEEKIAMDALLKAIEPFITGDFLSCWKEYVEIAGMQGEVGSCDKKNVTRAERYEVFVKRAQMDELKRLWIIETLKRDVRDLMGRQPLITALKKNDIAEARKLANAMTLTGTDNGMIAVRMIFELKVPNETTAGS